MRLMTLANMTIETIRTAVSWPLLMLSSLSSRRLRSMRPVVAQLLDLVGKVDALVGDDPLQHAHPLLQPLGVRRILRGLLRRLRALQLELALLELQPGVDPDAADDRDEAAEHAENGNEDTKIAHRQFLGRRRASISCVSRWLSSVTIRSTLASRSLTEPSSARSCAFSWLTSFTRSITSSFFFG